MSTETPSMQASSTDRPPLLQGVRGLLYVMIGCVFVGLGVLGAMLPVLPTTPFLLLASFFFLRSSPRLNEKLLNSPLLGPFLRDWYRYHGVRPKVKVVAVSSMLLAVLSSLLLGNLPWYVIVLLLTLAAIGLTVVLRLPVIREESGLPAAEPIPVLGEENASAGGAFPLEPIRETPFRSAR